MVRHGRDRKRRSGRRSTKLKTYRTWVRWDPKPKNLDQRVKKHWDTTISPSANLRNMGLSALPNDLNQSKQSSTPAAVTKSTVVELFDIPTSDQPSRRSRFPLDEKEEAYISKCMAKHGDNYGKMFRDVKGVNDYQWTEHQLRKCGARYLLLTPGQRRLDVPAKVMDLLPDDVRAQLEEQQQGQNEEEE